MRFVDPKTKPLPLGASLAVSDIQRGATAKFEYGPRVWRRTVVVYVPLQASRSPSQAVLFVGRFRHGYRVWRRVH